MAGLIAVSLLGYHLTFDAEMNGPADLSAFTYAFANGDTTLWTNREAETYVPYDPNDPATPFSFENGALTITARPDPAHPGRYLSGMLSTSGIFSQSSGYFEMRAKTPAAPGFWPSFWLLPEGAGYPELDILEQPNNSGVTNQYWTRINTPTDNNGGWTTVDADVTQGYHRYGLLWTPKSIQFAFDGYLVGYPHVTPPSLAGLPMYLLATMAVGGPYSWPGVPPAGAVSGVSIDYIRVYSNNPADPEVAPAAVSAPDGWTDTPALRSALRAPPPAGTGSGRLVLSCAETAWEGDAKFTIAIDGVSVGGTRTCRAADIAGQTQDFLYRGEYGTAPHVVTMDFVNNAGGEVDGEDRNLFLRGATLGGRPVTTGHLAFYGGGPQSFSFKGGGPAAGMVGKGPDCFVLGISEAQGADQAGTPLDARYTVAVDGKRVGLTRIARALAADGQTQKISVCGTFGTAAHTLALSLLDTGSSAAGKTLPAATAPQLFVDSARYNGFPTPGGTLAIASGTGTLTQPAIGPDTLTLALAEDAWQGDAMVEIALDGAVLGTVTVTASASAGATQTVSYTGTWGGTATAHRLTLTFLNDAYAAPGQDRNLYLRTVCFDGTTVSRPAVLSTGGHTVVFILAQPPI